MKTLFIEYPDGILYWFTITHYSIEEGVLTWQEKPGIGYSVSVEYIRSYWIENDL